MNSKILMTQNFEKFENLKKFEEELLEALRKEGFRGEMKLSKIEVRQIQADGWDVYIHYSEKYRYLKDEEALALLDSILMLKTIRKRLINNIITKIKTIKEKDDTESKVLEKLKEDKEKEIYVNLGDIYISSEHLNIKVEFSNVCIENDVRRIVTKIDNIVVDRDNNTEDYETSMKVLNSIREMIGLAEKRKLLQQI